MTPKKLAECLLTFSSVIGDPLIADSVKGLSNVVKSVQIPKGQQVSMTLANRLANAPVGHTRPLVGDVNNALLPLRTILTIASTPKARVEIQNFFTLLQQNEEMSFSVFLSRAGTPSGAPSPRVGKYVDALHEVVADSDEFEALIVRLKKDKDVTPDELSDIASAFTGLRKKWGNKAAVEAILAKHSAHLKAVTAFKAANGKSAA